MIVFLLSVCDKHFLYRHLKKKKNTKGTPAREAWQQPFYYNEESFGSSAHELVTSTFVAAAIRIPKVPERSLWAFHGLLPRISSGHQKAAVGVV